ncbi:MAG: hypothetical protein M0Q91_15650 [Methanoregula sp.]|jgi:hypothetical protein|nr:hypothetical protein [Methanoregula sp.]
MAKLRSFQLLKPAEYSGPVAAGYAALNKLTPAERLAAFQKWQADVMATAEALFATGSCSKAQVVEGLGKMCPF